MPKSLGIMTNTPEVVNDEVADTAIALCSVFIKIVTADNFARNNWINGDFPLTKKFTGTKLGIVGMGRIGKAIAERAEAFKCEVYYHSGNKDVKYKYFNDLKELAKEVDTLCIITLVEKNRKTCK